MTFSIPTLAGVRTMVRDHVMAHLPQATALVPNSLLRVLSEAMAGLAHLVLEFVRWLARQLMVDQCDEDWLVRHGEIWTIPRKAGVLAEGTVNLTGTQGEVVPRHARLRSSVGVEYETTADTTLGAGATNAPIRALDPGAAGNLDAGALLAFASAQPGVTAQASVVTLTGGADDEALEDWRDRILARIQEPPHGGAAHDYVAWAKEVPGCTRAWSAGTIGGVGTQTTFVMFDELRAAGNGFPLQEDLDAVAAHIDGVRPVTVREHFALGATPKVLDFEITRLDTDTTAVRAAIEAEVRLMLRRRAAPGQTAFRSWVAEAVSIAAGEDSHDLTMMNLTCAANEMAVMGTITWPS